MTAPHPDLGYSLLLHAYGTAADTPAHLAALVREDERARADAVLHLNSAIMHQGTPWTATGPVAAHCCALVGRDELSDPGTLSGVLDFLHDVAEAAEIQGDDLEGLAHPAGRDVDAEVAALLSGADPDDGPDLIYEDEVLTDAVMARAVLSCRAVLPAVRAAAAHALRHPAEEVRTAAGTTAATADRVTATLAAERTPDASVP
ncbi:MULTISPECIES: hypothetical protein [Streptomyces]|uniref:Uncharacterized protein n=1 Tax=Streptomyces doudnae TaxID=3075536 RepID=A0ABD5EQ51_9ACTN|nr:MULTISPECIES: hypothetical protein [unclassified Streptomyces]MDT0436750.1 hypothetical protein [Streptomyces sp. DSM 41981]MYQ67467.1 hypothetical protein [Streptomyces sp. SID4950]SCE35393.1 hypothetical protein GA0115242_132627 [Streptomyces sp. SolWspMP-5a-2]